MLSDDYIVFVDRLNDGRMPIVGLEQTQLIKVSG
jgi:hypothetical protein